MQLASASICLHLPGYLCPPYLIPAAVSVCHNVHTPKEADIIFVDYTLNDPADSHPIMDNPVR